MLKIMFKILVSVLFKYHTMFQVSVPVLCHFIYNGMQPTPDKPVVRHLLITYKYMFNITIITIAWFKHHNHVTTYYAQTCVPFHVRWVKSYSELNLTSNWHAVWPFVIVDFVVAKHCRTQKHLLIDALYLNVNDYF